MLLAWSSDCETTLDMSDGVDEVKVGEDDEKGEMGMQALRRVVWSYKNGARFTI